MRSGLIFIVVAAIAVSCNRAASGKPGDSRSPASTITPVEGPSWLNHLGVNMGYTHLGQRGGTAPPPATARREPQIRQDATTQALGELFTLTGSDLYRINCRTCHGAHGNGAPPEIPSLIGPVQGTSATLIQRRMEQKGTPISEEMAAQMADEAERAIQSRLQKGGEKMPAFPQLRPEELAALLRYLRQLAELPNTEPIAAVNEPAAHVGEEVIKGTCHICHDATGPGGSRMTIMMRGIVPSLASMPEYQSLDAVVQQVHYGTRMMMMMGGNRMPPFPYFTDQEISAAYLYLQAYSPVK